jgi:hypothetical protein
MTDTMTTTVAITPKKTGISIDYGVKNFAYVKFTYTPETMSFDSFDVVQFSKQKEKRMRELLAFFSTHVASVDVVLGEQQLMANATTLELSNMMHLLSLIHI